LFYGPWFFLGWDPPSFNNVMLFLIAGIHLGKGLKFAEKRKQV
jgi:hypothetical protein